MSQAHIATAFHFFTSNFRCTSILWMAGRRDPSRKVNLRLDAFESSLEDKYCPAGSLSSRNASPIGSDDDLSHPAPLQAQLSPDPSSFHPTSDNVIVFEVFTPTSQEERQVLHQDCFVIAEEIKTESREVTSPDLGSSGYSGDEDDHASVQEDTKASFLAEVLKLQQTVAQQRGEIKGLKMLLKERDVVLAQLHAGKERKEKGTMTAEEDKIKSEQLAASCKRYERQNLELRREIQSCTKDLLDLDKAKSDLFHSLKQSQQLLTTYEQDFLRLSRFLDHILQRTSEDPVSDPSLLPGYVISKAEIVAARLSRLQTSCDRLGDENERLVRELEAGTMSAQSRNSEQSELVKQLQTRIKLKDRFIQKLERTLDGYKEKIREEDLESSWKPTSKTENFSLRIKDLVKPDPPSRSKALESDEDVFRSAYLSGAESLNHTLDVQRKGDNAKPSVWKQRRRNLHHRTQSQNLFALENYQPVLLARIKENRGRDVLSLTSKRQITPKGDSQGKSVSLERKKTATEAKTRGKSLQRR